MCIHYDVLIGMFKIWEDEIRPALNAWIHTIRLLHGSIVYIMFCGNGIRSAQPTPNHMSMLSGFLGENVIAVGVQAGGIM